MANANKGEVGFNAGEEDFKISFSADALCEMEDALKCDLDQIIKMLSAPEKIKLSDMRVMFWKGLADQNPEMTFDEARKVLRKIDAVKMATLVGQAFVLSMPVDDGAAQPNPPQPDGQKPGTGPASSRRGSGSV